MGVMDADRVPLGSGWDSEAVLVDGRWVERTARRPAARRGLRTEVRLLPWLSGRLPLAVPAPAVVSEEPFVVRHAYLPGAPSPDPTPEHGRALGAFLRALHDLPLGPAVARGLPAPATTRGWRDATFARVAGDVLPRLSRPGDLCDRLDRLREAPADTLVHGDLGPDHVRIQDGAISGVIDWSDARAGDPAKDLSWLLLDAGPEVAAAVLDAYGDDLTARARDWRAVAPCYAVLHGLDTGDARLVASSLDQLER